MNCQYTNDESRSWNWREGNGTEAKRQEYSVEMACGGEKVTFEDAPLSFKSVVWEHFGFSVDYNSEGAKVVNKNETVCKHCLTHVRYANGNTSNMMGHLRRRHPNISLAGTRKESDSIGKKQQTLLPAAFQKTFQINSDKYKEITKAIGVFIAKDLQPFSVVSDAGFRHLVKKLEPRYTVPSRTHFTNKVIPELYEQTREGIENQLAKTPYTALTSDGWTSCCRECRQTYLFAEEPDSGGIDSN